MAPPEPSRRSSPFFWAVLAAGVLVIGLHLTVGVLLVRQGEITRDFGWEARWEGESWVITGVDEPGPAAERLRAGDRLLALNGDARLRYGLDLLCVAVPPHASYRLRLARGPTILEVVLPASIRAPGGHLWRFVLPRLLLSMAFLATGLLVGLLRPRERITRLLAEASLATSLWILWSALMPQAELSPPVAFTVAVLACLPLPFQLALGYDFFYEFPPGRPAGRPWAAVRIVLYLWAAVCWLGVNPLSLLALLSPEQAVAVLDRWGKALAPLEGVSTAFDLTALFAILAVMVRNYRRVIEPAQARRLRWVMYGSLLAVLSNFTRLILVSLEGRLEGTLLAGALRWNTWLNPVFGALMPATFSYAVLKHRLLEVRVVVRSGLRYLLAKNALRLALFLPAGLLGVGILSHPDRTLAQIVSENPGYLLLAGAAAVSLRFRRPLRWLDRRFFREAYDQEQILVSLIDGIRACDSLAEVSRLVSEGITSALHPTRVHVFYRDPASGGQLSLGHSSGGARSDLRIPETSDLVRIFEAQGHAEDASAIAVGLPDRQLIDGLGGHLLVPIGGGDQRLRGLLLLGEKKSEEPYTRLDRRLLEAATAQIGIVCENLALKEQVVREQRIRDEVLAHLSPERLSLMKECPDCGRCYEGGTLVCERDGSELVLSLPVSRDLDGKYRLERLLGRGGMGAVYEATDLRLGRRVAVKVMTGRLFGEQRALRRFEREARAVARLAHPNVVTVFDYGQVGADGAYLVMERLHGQSLRAELKARGGVPPAEAAGWFEQAFAGVGYAHTRGVVHRDLKPDNLFILRDEAGPTQVKIVDFGLAKVLLPEGTEPTSLTVPGSVLGTFNYMSPEQLAGQDADERSDIFALGVIVAETLTGRHPFAGRTPAEVLSGLLQQPLRLPGESIEIRELEAGLSRCVEKDAARRLRSVAEMQEQLIPLLRRCPPLPGAAPPSPDAPTEAMGEGGPEKGRTR